MKKFENLKEYLEEQGYNETETNNIINLITYDYIVADQYEECVADQYFDTELFYKNYYIYTDKEKFFNDWFDGQVMNNEQLINKINSYGGGLSVSYDEGMTTFIVDIR